MYFYLSKDASVSDRVAKTEELCNMEHVLVRKVILGFDAKLALQVSK